MIDASTFWKATERVRKALRSLIPSGGAGILVALSGGADSVFLLSCLSKGRKESRSINLG